MIEAVIRGDRVLRCSAKVSTLVLLVASGNADAALRMSNLRTEGSATPLAVAASAPRFSWWVEGEAARPGEWSCSVEVRDAEGGNSPVWRSADPMPCESSPLTYGGPRLAASHRYSWRVRAERAEQSGASRASWSDPAEFVTAPDLTSRPPVWIGHPRLEERSPLLRTEFAVRQGLVAARMHVSAIGYAEAYVNGEKTDDALLSPAASQPERRVYYETHDVTGRLRAGRNAVGLWLAEGQAAMSRPPTDRYANAARSFPAPYDAPRAWARLELFYRDGAREVVETDGSWKTAPSPLRLAHFYGGEAYDARAERRGWSAIGHDDRSWDDAVVRPVTAAVSPQPIPAMRATAWRRPAARRTLRPGVWLFDIGRNVGGIWRLKVRGQRGGVVTVRGAETLDGAQFPGAFGDARGISRDRQHSLGGYYERDAFTTYVLRGEGEESYSPRFFYSGFAYLEVQVEPATALAELEVETSPLHTDLSRYGTFRSSDPSLDRLFENSARTLGGVLQSIPASNPSSEKYGWTADAHLIAAAASAVFDMSSFWEKWLVDLRDAQALGGGASLPPTVPNFRGARGEASIAWGSAYPLIAWHAYRHSGDTSVVREHYESIRAWVESVAASTVNGLVVDAWGDHGAPGFDANGAPADFPRTRELAPLVGTAYYARAEEILSEFATLLGRAAEAARHLERRTSAVERLNATFLEQSAGRYSVTPPTADRSPFQTANLIPLQFGFTPPGLRPTILRAVEVDIEQAHGGHLMTGILGTKALVEVLTRERRGELLARLSTVPSFPGWGYWLANGATTHWQSWNGESDHFHGMFSSIAEFLVEGVAGIVPPTGPGTEPGWRRVRVAPQFLERLRWAEATVPTPRGILRSRWERSGEKIRVEIELPGGVEGTLELPGEGGRPLRAGRQTILVPAPADGR